MLSFLRLSIPLSDPPQSRHHRGIITDIESEREYPRFTLKSSNKRFIVYSDTIDDYSIGDNVMVSGEVDFPFESGFFNGFDYQNYLRSIRIDGIIYAQHTESLEASYNQYLLRAYAHQYIEENHPHSRDYLKAFLLAERSEIEDEHYALSQSLGIAHLFAVSGLHVGFMIVIIKKGLSTLKLSAPLIDFMLCGSLIFYLFLTGFAPSVLRASLMFCLLVINKRKNLGFSSLDCALFLCTVLILVHPFFIYQIGFQLSFLISITLLLSQKILLNKTYLQQSLIVSSLSFLISAPIILSMQGSLNLLSILFNVFYVLLMALVLLPGAYLTLVLPFLDPIYGYILTLFETSMIMIKETLSFQVRFLIPSGLFMILYLIGVYAMYGAKTYRKKINITILWLLGILMVNITIMYQPFQTFTMYDVDGDAFLLRDGFNRCNILIDTGNKDNHHQLISALHQQNIKRLDYALISHKHMDHYGEYDAINQNFTISNTYTNANQHLIDNQWKRCGNIDFFIFERHKDFGNENDNSMILKVRFMEKRILFTGDIEASREASFIDNYHFEIDVLKVAHHGSITSTSEAFLDHFEPQKALVPARRNNRFSHPSPTVIHRLESRDIDVYSLKTHGSIRWSKFGPFEFKKCALSE